jgi:predicted kinase
MQGRRALLRERYAALVDASGAQPRVIIFTGLPGTGKSTLAEQVARTVSAPAFNGDWLMGALKPAHAALAKLERPDYVAAWFSRLRTLVTRQLMLGQSAVVEDLVTESQFSLWRETADRFSARLFLVECICSDEAIHRARIEGRTRGIPGWHEVGWDHVERMRGEVTPLIADRLTADALEPLADNLRRVLGYIAA